MKAIYTARVDSAICRLGPGDLSSLLLKLLEEIGVLLKNLFLRSIKIKRMWNLLANCERSNNTAREGCDRAT